MKYVAIVQGKQRTVEISQSDGLFHVTLDGKSFLVDAFRPGHQSLSMLIEGQTYEVGIAKSGSHFSVYFYNDTIEFDLMDARKFRSSGETRSSGSSGPLKIHAPMPGKIIKVTVTEQSTVQEGDALLVIEAMKMQNELKAPKSGRVSKINVREGEAVSNSQVLLVLD
jgi:biotin carboxyl carrier protein